MKSGLVLFLVHPVFVWEVMVSSITSNHANYNFDKQRTIYRKHDKFHEIIIKANFKPLAFQ